MPYPSHGVGLKSKISDATYSICELFNYLYWIMTCFREPFCEI